METTSEDRPTSDDRPASVDHRPASGDGRTGQVAVIVHSGKDLGDGPARLRELLADAGHPDPLWYEVPKSKHAPKRAEEAVNKGAGLLFVWGGDGTVQRCIDAVVGCDVAVAIIPAGTSNLLASNLGIPQELGRAVEIGLHGDRRVIDTGTVNGEHFAVMAGAGLDAMMMHDADGGLKDRIGRAAYLYTGARNVRSKPVKTKVELDGERFFKGRTTLVIVGNMGRIVGGIEVFQASEPDDGVLELGVVTAKGAVQWLRALGRTVVGDAADSPFVSTARGRSITVSFRKAVPYELDGGDRDPVDTLRIAVAPASVTVCVPRAGQDG